ncbi:MAG: hypothetical protein K2K90_19995, partial [Lachnospiraceae bacterium]|nr:hypothetical protein [Lachnospiraceae bacterium]
WKKYYLFKKPEWNDSGDGCIHAFVVPTGSTLWISRQRYAILTLLYMMATEKQADVFMYTVAE